MLIMLGFLAISPWVLYKGFTNPSFFMLIFLAFTLLRLQELFPVLVAYPIPFIAISVGVISLIYNLLIKKIDIYWCREMNYLTWFILWSGLSALLSFSDQSIQFWLSKIIKVGIAYFLIAWTLKSKKDYLWIIIFCLIGGVMISLFTLYNKYNAIGLIEETRASITFKKGLLGDPNDLALYLLVFFSFSVSVAMSTYVSTMKRLIGLLSAICIAAGAVATQSRGGLLGFIAVIATCFSYRTKSKSLVFLIAPLLLVVFYYMANIGGRVSGGSMGLENGLDESSSGRLEAWKAAIMMALNHPLFGVGPNNFGENFYSYSMIKSQMVTHSTWFSILSETGFIGCGLFIFCVYLAFKSIKLTLKELESATNNSQNAPYLVMAYGLYLGLIGFCVTGTFINQGFSWIFFILFALITALSHRDMTADQSKSSAIRKS